MDVRLFENGFLELFSPPTLGLDYYNLCMLHVLWDQLSSENRVPEERVYSFALGRDTASTSRLKMLTEYVI